MAMAMFDAWWAPENLLEPGLPAWPVAVSTNPRTRHAVDLLLLDEAKPGKFKIWMRFKDGSTNWETWSDAYVDVEQK